MKNNEIKCFYCGTQPINATTQKDLKTCCYYMLQNDNGKIKQYYKNEKDEIIDQISEKIMEENQKLKEEKINGDVLRWWLYFGGNDNNGE